MEVDGHKVARIRVDRVSQGWVQTSDGRLLVRAGPTNRTLVGEELARFVRERSTEPVEDMPVPNVSIADLRQEDVRRFLRTRLRRQRVNAEVELRTLGFLDPEGRVRLATLLLFGREPQHDYRRFGIEIQRFDGSVDDVARTLRGRTQLKGDLATLVESADQMIYDEMRRDAVIRGLVREEVPEFPPIAIREALLNAVGHRDYSLKGSSVQVRLFADGIEIGAHTANHVDLTTAGSTLNFEVAGSKASLEAVVGHPVLDFCYPSGKFNAQVVQAVQAAGYESATTTMATTLKNTSKSTAK